MKKNILISKEKFTEHMERIRNYMDFDDKLNELLRNYRHMFVDDIEIMLPTVFLVDTVNLLELVTADDAEWIAYFIFELDFGRSWKPGTVTAQDGTDIPLDTIDDLWNLLVEE